MEAVALDQVDIPQSDAKKCGKRTITRMSRYG
jgi:hypothetical protein